MMPVSLSTPPFPGFTPEAFAFLRDLAAHNDRDWFKPRKSIYDDEILEPLRHLLVETGRRATGLGLPLVGDPKRGVFRIYRDTRFSKDKSPYKTNAGGVLSRTGHRNDPGVIYIQLKPGENFLAAGFYRPDKTLLHPWREEMASDPERFLDMQTDLADQNLDLYTNDALKRMPRGFEAHADSSVAEYLRWKSFLVVQSFEEADAQTPAFVDRVLTFAQHAASLLRYGWSIIDERHPV